MKSIASRRTLIIVALTLVPVIFIVWVGVAKAVNAQQADDLAHMDQSHNCVVHGFPMWLCDIPYAPEPTCQRSTLPSGRGQWLCTGTYTQRSKPMPIIIAFKNHRAHSAKMEVYSRACTNRLRYDKGGSLIVNNQSCVSLGFLA